MVGPAAGLVPVENDPKRTQRRVGLGAVFLKRTNNFSGYTSYELSTCSDAAIDKFDRARRLALVQRKNPMRAVQLTAFGNPIDGLECVDIPEPRHSRPKPGPDRRRVFPHQPERPHRSAGHLRIPPPASSRHRQ